MRCIQCNTTPLCCPNFEETQPLEVDLYAIDVEDTTAEGKGMMRNDYLNQITGTSSDYRPYDVRGKVDFDKGVVCKACESAKG